MSSESYELLVKINSVLYKWSGVSEATPDDEVVLSDGDNLEFITVGDLRDALSFLNKLKMG